MALADTNFWIALTFSGHGHHQAARAWLAGQRGAESALFCRSTQQSFLRLITTAAVCRPLGVPPLGNRDAWSVFEGFAADPRVGWADEPPGLAAQWKRLSSGSAPSPKLWMDAYLAAFALVGRHGIVTTDKAFKQFKSVAVVLLEAT